MSLMIHCISMIAQLVERETVVGGLWSLGRQFDSVSRECSVLYIKLWKSVVIKFIVSLMIHCSPVIAQLVERETVVGVLWSLGQRFDSISRECSVFSSLGWFFPTIIIFLLLLLSMLPSVDVHFSCIKLCYLLPLLLLPHNQYSHNVQLKQKYIW